MGVLGGWRAGTDLKGHFLRVKYIRMMQANEIATIKEERGPEVKECQESEMSLKKPIVTPSSESQVLVGSHCVWNIVSR